MSVTLCSLYCLGQYIKQTYTCCVFHKVSVIIYTLMAMAIDILVPQVAVNVVKRNVLIEAH